MQGIRILDFTQVLSGPFATMLLSDAGADVVKVERPPQGDITRQWGPPFLCGKSIYFAAFNRGKKSITADFRNSHDRDVVRQLAARADVVIENLRPGTLERFGLGYLDLKSECSRLVYVSIRGYRENSPRARDPALEVVLEGESGLMAITGNPDQPARQGIAVIDMMTGALAVAKIMEALYARERRGQGDHVVLSLEETAQLLMTHPYLMHTATQSPYPAAGTTHPSIAPYEHFATADTPIIVGAVNDAEFARLSQLLGHPEWARGPWSSNAGRVADRLKLHAALEAIFRTEPGPVWVDRLGQAKLVVGLVRPLADAAEAWRNDDLPKLSSHDNRWGSLVYPASPWKKAGLVTSAPDLGEDGLEVVSRWLEKRDGRKDTGSPAGV
ncbi:CaiB/BaiF CoA transferase family protein [Sulfobacillus harzensis]|uniref:CoA transferase n=1 Tax=Sulfobacillus harzensis TaxID=2729629 RepID=A0A7Y0L7G7_9FIRM|nr:CoA transferase [Sulfobacillus harzensis]NMP23835.1 CoA transferase [Sulfobacillus harzensis]